ncbi:MAG: protein kinase [Nanoarchaeota archaeon]
MVFDEFGLQPEEKITAGRFGEVIVSRRVKTGKATEVYICKKPGGGGIVVKRGLVKAHQDQIDLLGLIMGDPNPGVLVPLDFSVNESGQLEEIYDYTYLNTLYDMTKFGCFLNTPTVIEIAKGISSSLAFFHNAGFVHHDVRRPNVFVHMAPIITVKMFDYDASRRPYSGRERLDLNDTAPEYKSSDNISFSYDIYQLGKVLDFMSRSPYFQDRDNKTKNVIDKATSEKPSNRYQDGSEMLEVISELESVLTK